MGAVLYAAHQAGIPHAVSTSSRSVYANNGLGHAGADKDAPLDSDRFYGFTKRLLDWKPPARPAPARQRPHEGRNHDHSVLGLLH